ncbi:MAG: hypothetical protein ACKOX6_03610 [Bdellovibrio sp.]
MLQFVREIPISIVIEGASSARRGFLFHLAAGFSKDVNPLSGMTVNLMLVDKWLGGLKTSLEQDIFISKSDSLSHAFAEILAVTRLNLIERAEAEAEQATLVSLSFREERGWSFSWNDKISPENMIVKYSQFLEAFLQEREQFALLKADFSWLRVLDCEADFSHESFKVVKNLSASGFSELTQKLSLEIGKKVDSGSFLESVTVHNLTERFSLTL